MQPYCCDIVGAEPSLKTDPRAAVRASRLHDCGEGSSLTNHSCQEKIGCRRMKKLLNSVRWDRNVRARDTEMSISCCGYGSSPQVARSHRLSQRYLEVRKMSVKMTWTQNIAASRLSMTIHGVSDDRSASVLHSATHKCVRRQPRLRRKRVVVHNQQSKPGLTFAGHCYVCADQLTCADCPC